MPGRMAARRHSVRAGRIQAAHYRVMPLRARCRFQTDELEHSDILGPLESQARDLRKLRSAPEPALVLHPAAGLRPRKSPAQRRNGTTVARLLLRPKAVVVPGDVMRARLPRPPRPGGHRRARLGL